MGLLDDAIREHLELKRQHGVDPGEIERQEQEAFGSTARREDPEVQSPDAGEDLGEDGPAAVQAGPEDFAADAPTTVYDAARDDVAADEIEPPAGEEEVPGPGHEADAPGYDEDPWVDDDEGEPPARPAAEQAPPAEDDVLEETPDFLQETPEHDRLWFEQKPPRDFDWDR
jgi:hypothetical protein